MPHLPPSGSQVMVGGMKASDMPGELGLARGALGWRLSRRPAGRGCRHGVPAGVWKVITARLSLLGPGPKEGLRGRDSPVALGDRGSVLCFRRDVAVTGI